MILWSNLMIVVSLVSIDLVARRTKKRTQVLLQKIQRLALFGVTGAMSTHFTTATEVLLVLLLYICMCIRRRYRVHSGDS